MISKDLLPLGSGSESASALAQFNTPSPARKSGDEAPNWSKELIRAIAMDIGRSVIHHIEIMYPKALEGMPSTFKLSVRNHTYNEIMAAIEVNGEGEVIARLSDREAHRRKISAVYRKIRKKTNQ